MVALGVSGIGDVRGAFVQNVKKLTDYYAAIDARTLSDRSRLRARPPTIEIRRYVITELMCNVCAGYARASAALRHRRSTGTSRDELAALTGADSPAADGLVQVSAQSHRRDAARPHVRPQHLHDRSTQYLRARTGGPTPVFSRTV